MEVEGSLGGLQILDLTPEGHPHQRILSMGEDPLTRQEQNERTTLNILASMTAEMYSMSGYQAPVIHPAENQAFSFSIKRSAVTCDTGNNLYFSLINFMFEIYLFINTALADLCKFNMEYNKNYFIY